jgi:transcriptional regulator CtsR
MCNNNSEYLSVEQFEDYLHTTLAESTNDEVMYLRTNVVADELELSRQQVGQLFKRHKSRSQAFDIERRSKSNRTGQGSKWKIVLNESREPESIVCDVCGETFASQQALHGHRQVHQSDRSDRKP